MECRGLVLRSGRSVLFYSPAISDCVIKCSNSIDICAAGVRLCAQVLMVYLRNLEIFSSARTPSTKSFYYGIPHSFTPASYFNKRNVCVVRNVLLDYFKFSVKCITRTCTTWRAF